MVLSSTLRVLPFPPDELFLSYSALYLAGSSLLFVFDGPLKAKTFGSSFYSPRLHYSHYGWYVASRPRRSGPTATSGMGLQALPLLSLQLSSFFLRKSPGKWLSSERDERILEIPHSPGSAVGQHGNSPNESSPIEMLIACSLLRSVLTFHTSRAGILRRTREMEAR